MIKFNQASGRASNRRTKVLFFVCLMYMTLRRIVENISDNESFLRICPLQHIQSVEGNCGK
jgi:hypothetical protein